MLAKISRYDAKSYKIKTDLSYKQNECTKFAMALQSAPTSGFPVRVMQAV